MRWGPPGRAQLRNSMFSIRRRHFRFVAGGRQVAYCYIRKNACSAFKRLICETSEVANFSEFEGSELAFLDRHHLIRDIATLGACDLRLLVYRDPYERLVSIYLNKLVARSSAEGILKNFAAVTQYGPAWSDLPELRVRILQAFLSAQDVHVYPQSSNLPPIRYDTAIPLSSLHATLFRHLLGASVADRYFAQPTNGTVYGNAEGEPAIDVPAAACATSSSKAAACPPVGRWPTASSWTSSGPAIAGTTR